jgi:hypothetical protein
MPSPEDPPHLERPAAAGSPRTAFVVLGMHRSGTSAVAGSLQRLGVNFGPRLMPPTPDNPRGFYEHIDIVNLHDRLLLAAGSSWDDTDPRPPDWLAGPHMARFRDDLRDILRRDFAAAPLWGLKDPRLCWLLPWWEPLWAELQTRPLFVIVLRDPRDVAASLARRDGFSPGKAYLLWLQHILAAERATRQAERVFVDFADFLIDWRQALAPAGELFGRPWPVSPASDGSLEERFVDGALPRANPTPGGGQVPIWVDELDTALRRERRTGRELFALADRLAEQAEAAQSLYGCARERAGDLALQLAAVQQQARWYEAEWQKARRRWEEDHARLERARNEVLELKQRVITKDRSISVLREQDMSFLRKAGSVVTKFLNVSRRR